MQSTSIDGTSVLIGIDGNVITNTANLLTLNRGETVFIAIPKSTAPNGTAPQFYSVTLRNLGGCAGLGASLGVYNTDGQTQVPQDLQLVVPMLPQQNKPGAALEQPQPTDDGGIPPVDDGGNPPPVDDGGNPPPVDDGGNPPPPVDCKPGKKSCKPPVECKPGKKSCKPPEDKLPGDDQGILPGDMPPVDDNPGDEPPTDVKPPVDDNPGDEPPTDVKPPVDDNPGDLPPTDVKPPVDDNPGDESPTDVEDPEDNTDALPTPVNGQID